MEFKLNFNINPADFNVKHGDGVVLLGSCFSDSMTSHFQYAGFDVLSNPFGTLFHPLAISNTIGSSLSDSKEVIVLKREDVFLAWDCGSKVFGYSEEELISKVIEERINLKNQLSKAKLLVVTFGTAWGYRRYEEIKLNRVVGNCHKEPASSFLGQMFGTDEMFESWLSLIGELKKLNPKIEIVFNVSPVRHKKDGLIWIK